MEKASAQARAARGNQLAAAFLLAHSRNDDQAMRLLLDESSDDTLAFNVALASLAASAVTSLTKQAFWQRYLTQAVGQSLAVAALLDKRACNERGRS